MRSFDQDRDTSTTNTAVFSNLVNYRKSSSRLSKTSTQKKSRWDCGDESHFRGDARCPKRKEPQEKLSSSDENQCQIEDLLMMIRIILGLKRLAL